MTTPTLHYDEMSDTLYISFTPGEPATGIELNPHILLRINATERRAVGLTLFDYSLLAQPTDVGPRSVPLIGLTQLSLELRELALEIIQHPPVSNFLMLSAYAPSASEIILMTSLHPLPAVA